MTNNVFLIGATGHIGKALIEELVPDHAAGRLHVKAGVHSAKSRDLVTVAGVAAADFDLNDFASFDSALAGSDTVFLLRPYTLKQMMMGKQVIDAASRVRVKHIVTLGAFGNPDTPYPVIGWNFLVESWAERSGMNWTHLRPNYFMDNLLVQRDKTTNTIFNSITRPVSWIASEDIAAVAAAVIRNPQAHAGQAYPLASVAASIADITQTFAKFTGKPHTHAAPPTERLKERLAAQGREPDYAQALIDYIEAVQSGKVNEIANTYDTVERVAGRPALTWEAFLERHKAEL
jgi:uncharacterized protein YbjT (DUF2867 family)